MKSIVVVLSLLPASAGYLFFEKADEVARNNVRGVVTVELIPTVVVQGYRSEQGSVQSIEAPRAETPAAQRTPARARYAAY